MRPLVAITVLVVSLCARRAFAEASLCRKSEKTAFSCAIKDKPKTISVCFVKKKGSAGYVKYRFGAPGKIELEFPVDYPEADGNNFSIFHYEEDMNRNFVQSLSFAVGDDPKKATTYAVFAGLRPIETPEPRSFAGVRVLEGSSTHDLTCRVAPTNHLDEVKLFLSAPH